MQRKGQAMAIMTKEDVRGLIDPKIASENPTLSVYLNVSRSQSVNINRGFEVALKSLFKSLRGTVQSSQKNLFEENTKRVEDFVKNYRSKARSLAIFSDVSRKFFRSEEFMIPLPSLAFWDENPYITPMLEALDEYERYCVILTDRQKARLFKVYLGTIEEIKEFFAPNDVKRVKSTPSDTLRSQPQYERTTDLHALWHLKNIAEKMAEIGQGGEFDRLVLAGPNEISRELYNVLPETLRKRVVGFKNLPVYAKDHEVLEQTLEFEEAVERANERQRVRDLIESVNQSRNAVLGLEPTLASLRRGQIATLVYASHMMQAGSMCKKCDILLGREVIPCPYCSEPMKVVSDLIETIVERVIRMGGQIEQVHGEAAEMLKKSGNIGAFLRFKT